MQRLKSILDLLNRRRPWAGHALCLVFGLLMPLAFAPVEWRWVSWLSVTGFLLLLQNTAVKQAIIRAFIYNLAMFSVGVSWIYNSLHDFGSASVVVSALLTAAMVLACSTVAAAAFWLYARWRTASVAFNSLLLFPAAWIVGEWLRTWVLTGFPWLLLGYSQIDTMLAGYARLIGTLGIGFITASMAGAIGLLVLGSVRARVFALCMVISIPSLGALSGLLQWVEPTGDTLKVTVVQGNIPQELKLKPETLAYSIAHYRELSQPYQDSDLIVWPETAVPAFKHRVETALQPFYLQLRESGAELITGIFVYDFERELYYNSLYKLGSEEVYSKQHLVPFGEYMPFRGLLEFMNRFVHIPMSDIAPAVNVGLMPVAGHTAGLSICYETAYPSIFRRQLPQAEFFVNASNDAWFGDSLAPHQHLEMARMRALEAGRYLLRATNNGISAIIDPNGTVVQRSPQFMESVIHARINTMRGVTPYAVAGDWPVFLLIAFVFLAAALLIRDRRQK
jgi:apolipoprotein N-acyltransferase